MSECKRWPAIVVGGVGRREKRKSVAVSACLCVGDNKAIACNSNAIWRAATRRIWKLSGPGRRRSIGRVFGLVPAWVSVPYANMTKLEALGVSRG